MRFSASTLGFSLVFCACLAFLPAARAYDDRTAEAILKELEGVKLPDPSEVHREDEASVRKFLSEKKAAMIKQAELIAELYKVDPDNASLGKLFPERWKGLLAGGKSKLKTLKEETASIAAKSKDVNLKGEATYFYAVALNREDKAGESKARIAAIEDFVKLAPTDDRGAPLLYSAADEMVDTAQRTEALKRIMTNYPKSQFAKMVEGSLKQIESVGKPFDLEFTDAIKGTEVSMKTTLKGKVVVIDFWATWCGPCVEEMPTMKKIYAEYRDKGVEFVGVSLDAPKEEGGLDALKQFIAQNEILWPQYYQGKGGESEFSTSWSVNAIPTLFVVDAEGKLFSVNARGKLETMLPELLKKAKADAGGAAGGN